MTPGLFLKAVGLVLLLAGFYIWGFEVGFKYVGECQNLVKTYAYACEYKMAHREVRRESSHRVCRGNTDADSTLADYWR